MGKIKFLVMDVDGTLTDGKIYMGPAGESMKAFDIKDGAGIALLLPKMNIKPVIITARWSEILKNRCKELGIEELHQGSKDKMATLNGILQEHNADLSNVAYIGDDLPDVPCMNAVKEAGGLVLCPADAISEIVCMADYVSLKNAGDAAVRDCILYLERCGATAADKNKKAALEAEVKKVVNAVLSGDYKDGEIFGHPYAINDYMTKEEPECLLETHRYHIDVQYLIEGHESFKMYETAGLTRASEYNEVSDAEFWNGGTVATNSILGPGSLIVVNAGQPHKGCIALNGPEKVKKLVCKIEV